MLFIIMKISKIFLPFSGMINCRWASSLQLYVAAITGTASLIQSPMHMMDTVPRCPWREPPEGIISFSAKLPPYLSDILSFSYFLTFSCSENKRKIVNAALFVQQRFHVLLFCFIRPMFRFPLYLHYFAETNKLMRINFFLEIWED